MSAHPDSRGRSPPAGNPPAAAGRPPDAIPPAANLRVRARALTAVRAFFGRRGYLEVETPVRIPAPALETHIDAPPSGRAWLRTSPELQMKRLVAAGHARIYQIGPCFRAGERGARHNPEFTLLEWYRAGAGYRTLLAECRALLVSVVRSVRGATTLVYRGQAIDVAAPWTRLTVRQAFQSFAGWDPVRRFDAERFDADLVARVEPNLPGDRPCVLIDYPVEAAALARIRPGRLPVAERWELYAGGLELANAFSELTDATEQRARFRACAATRRAAGQAVYPLDEEFLSALEAGMPPCAGVALGFDRLAMLLCDTAAIDAVRPFCPPIGAPH